MADPLIQIVIPTHNRGWSIERAVDSVLAQSFTDWQLTIVDDGSTDDTVRRLAGYDDSRIEIVSQQQAGVSAARNRGWQSGTSPWVAFLDSDDAWQPDKLARQIEALEADPRYQACYTDEIWIRDGRRVNQKQRHAKYSGWIFRHCLPLCIISPSSIVMSRCLLEQHAGFDPELEVCEDYDLWLRLTASAPVLFLPELLITKYGGHDDQLSQSRWGMDIWRLRSLEKLWGSGVLTYQHRVWTAAVAMRKAEIVAAGFEKRGKAEEAAQWGEVADKWSRRSAVTGVSEVDKRAGS